jgi:hypothetical protein
VDDLRGEARQGSTSDGTYVPSHLIRSLTAQHVVLSAPSLLLTSRRQPRGLPAKGQLATSLSDSVGDLGLLGHCPWRHQRGRGSS